MCTLGYIISKTKIKNNFQFVEVVDDISKVENDKPYLIVGLSEAKKIASDKFSILHKELGNGNYWTFGRTEKRDEFEKDVIKFYNNILNYNINNIKYKYINILNINYNILKRLLKLCYYSKYKYIYIWNDMIYVLCKENNVIGISLSMLEYCGYKKEKILDRIKSNKYNIICDTDECISYKIKQRIKNKDYVVPYIMSLMEK